MIVPKEELASILRQYNSWWSGIPIPDIPTWRRSAFGTLRSWITSPPAPRAVQLTGARQVGKTTLFLQVIQSLVDDKVPPQRILYASFDHPVLKLVGVESVIQLWRELQPRSGEIEYLFLDEVQNLRDWQVWLKHQVDFEKRTRIAITGSSISLSTEKVESGVGRWHRIVLPTLSFLEYLQLKGISLPPLPEVSALEDVFSWEEPQFLRAGAMASPLIAHFHEYLIRGGFPQTALVDSVSLAQRLLREDIVDKVLQRDMTGLFGVRRVLELEKTFLYLCLHDGGLLDLSKLCENLELKKPTVRRFIELLEAAYLIYRVRGLGYGKEILRSKEKVYLADAAISGSVFLKGRSLLEDAARLGAAVATAVFKHVFGHYSETGAASFSYWRGARGLEVDIVVERGGTLLPVEVKYQSTPAQRDELRGLHQLCVQRKIPRSVLVTREMADFGILPMGDHDRPTGETPARILKIPAPLACLWLSRSETSSP